MSAFSRSRGEGCLSDLKIDRLMRGELTDEAARQHVGSCEACRARLGELEAARSAHQASAPALRRPRPRRRWAGLTAAATTALLAAAALVFVLRPTDGTRLKGGRSVTLFVEHAGKLRRAEAGEVVAPGDKLQLSYSSPTPFYGAILSVDGAQKTSRYFPDGDRAAPLEAGSQKPFPTSTVLDEVLGKETLFVLFCEQPIAPAPDAPGCHVERIEIEKR